MMDFRILGPLEVCSESGRLALGGRKPRALLAVLALHANEVVAADRLIDEVWGEDVPEGGAAALRLNISRLRKALPADVLLTKPPGYLLRVGPDELDLHRFERLVDQGRRLLAGGRADDASVRLREALAVWRGPPLADFAYEDFAQAALARLEEIRLGALELRIDSDLALGRHDELVGELKTLVAEHPLRERFRGYLMTALYRSGRQAEALDAFRDARRALVDELGIEPSPALQELELAVLRQDRALAVPVATRGPGQQAAERSILVAVADGAHVHALLAVAEPLARRAAAGHNRRQARASTDRARVGVGVARRTPLGTRRARPCRPHRLVHVDRPREDLARLATELDVDLVLTDAPDELLADGVPDEQLTALLAGAPCDVALLVPRDATPSGPRTGALRRGRG